MRTMSDGIRNWRPLLDRLKKLPHVVAASPGLYEPVLISRNGARAGGAMLKGIIPSEERTVSDMLNNIAQGSVAPLDENANTEGPVRSADAADRDWQRPGGFDWGEPERCGDGHQPAGAI
jgi:lipoprotein-releasing system permease protein